jgi:SHS2 domain-containing protein
MPYEYMDELTVADMAFRAWGQSLEETFVAAADAVMNAMVEELESIRPQEARTLSLEHEALDLLLFNFLQELIYYKDAEQLLLRIQQLEIPSGQSPYSLQATAVGERIDTGRHAMRVDVKAVTLHHFTLTQTEAGWEATVIVDI